MRAYGFISAHLMSICLRFLFAILLTLPLHLIAQNDLIDYTNPKEYEIGGISVSGVENLDENVLITFTDLKVGDKISVPGEDIPSAIKALWQQGLFSDVKIYADKVVNDVIFLKIELTERTRLSKYTFKGIRKGEEDDLRDKVALQRGRIITENLINTTRNAIIRHYIDKGFLNCEVAISQEKDDLFKNAAIMVIDVYKGQKVRINELRFLGNDNLISRKLRKQMKNTKERTRVNTKAGKIIWNDIKNTNFGHVLGNLSVAEALQYVDENVIRFKPFSNSKFIEDDFEMDKLAVIDYYNENGYRDAEITYDTIYNVNDKAIDIEMVVDEGRQYYFRDISWKGNSKYDDETLARLLGIERGDVYNKSLLDSRLNFDMNGNDISSLYMDDGYLFFQITPVEKSVVGDSIDIEISIYEGAQATIDDVFISGNDKTNEHVVRREIRTVPGNKFSRADLIRSQREIANLGYFDPEQIQINPIPNPQDGTVDIEYKVVEKPSDQLELSAGWGGNTVVGSIGVSFNNFSLRNMLRGDAWTPVPAGDGQRLSFRFQSTGRAFQSLNMSFTEPWLGGRRPNALTVSAYSTRSFRNSTTTDIDANDASVLLITGASLGLGRRLQWPDDNFTLQATMNYQRYRLRNWFSDFIMTDGSANNFNFNITLARYSLDQPIYPRSGSNVSLSVQFTPPYSALSNKDYEGLAAVKDFNELYKWAEYHKWKFKAEWYTALVGNLVLRTSAKFGMMGFYNSNIGHSPFERFELGDDGIANFNLYGKDIIALRGYEVVTSNVVERADGSFATGVGDPFYAKYTLELRYPMSLNPSSTIYALTFLEGGRSWNSFREFNPLEVYRSAGMGLRVFLPMFGTLGFDYGVGFDKNAGQADRFWDYLSRYGKFSVILGMEPE